jgi:5-methylcytosine-specific restriction endonuclease McrA
MNSGVSRALRALAMERESYTCALCANPANDIHHVIPRRDGGKSIMDNVIAVCRPCHRKLHREDYLPPDDYYELKLNAIISLADYYAEEHEREAMSE